MADQPQVPSDPSAPQPAAPQYAAPQPAASYTPLDQRERDSRLWATLCHLMALTGLVSAGVGCFVGPLVVWLIKRNEFPFVDEQGKEAVNFQLTMLIAFVAAFMSLVLGLGLILLPLVGVFDVVMVVVASIKANEGVHFRYPLCIRFIK